MKKLFIHSWLPFFALLLYVVHMNGQESHPIEGTWIFNGNSSYARMATDMQTHLDTIPDLRSKFYADYEGRTMIFLPNGNFVQVMGSGMHLNGTWTVEGSALIIRNSDGDSFYQEIGELTESSLVLLLPSYGEAKPLLPELHFTKK